MIDHAILDFARSLGMGEVRLGPNEPLAFDAGDLGRLTLLADRSRLLLGVSRCQESNSPAPCELLSACHFRNGHRWPLHASTSAGRYGFYVILNESQASAQNIQLAFDIMMGAMHKLTAA